MKGAGQGQVQGQGRGRSKLKFSDRSVAKPDVRSASSRPREWGSCLVDPAVALPLGAAAVVSFRGKTTLHGHAVFRMTNSKLRNAARHLIIGVQVEDDAEAQPAEQPHERVAVRLVDRRGWRGPASSTRMSTTASTTNGGRLREKVSVSTSVSTALKQRDRDILKGF